MKELSKIILDPIKALVKVILKKQGYRAMPIDQYDDVQTFRKTIGDLKSFRKAAEIELQELKDKLIVNENEVNYLRGYVDTSADLIYTLIKPHPVPRDSTELVDEDNLWNSSDLSPPDRSKEYPSCQWIEGGLSFRPGELRVCPNCTKDGGTPGLFQFSSGEFSIRDVLTRRKLIIQANQNGGFTPCKSCSFLEIRIWPPPKYLFDNICLSHFTTCNLFCDYCYATPVKKQHAPLSSIPALKPTFEWLIENKHLSPGSLILWGGGEPTINKEFESLFEFLSQHGATSQVFSNGVILSKNLLKAMKNKKATVMISLDAGSKEVFSQIKGKRVFEKVVQNIKEYVTADKYGVILKMIICDDNKHEVISFLRLAEECGVKIVCYDILMGQKHIRQEIIDAAALMKHEGMKRGLKVRIGEVGAAYDPADNVETKIEQSLNKLADEQPIL